MQLDVSPYSSVELTTKNKDLCHPIQLIHNLSGDRGEGREARDWGLVVGGQWEIFFVLSSSLIFSILHSYIILHPSALRLYGQEAFVRQDDRSDSQSELVAYFYRFTGSNFVHSTAQAPRHFTYDFEHVTV